MNEPRIWVVTLRGVFSADSYPEACMIADQIRMNGQADLEIEDGGDSLDVTQVEDAASGAIEATEVVNHLRTSRNMLIRTKIRQCFDLARELDFVAWALEKRRDRDQLEASGYDYGHFMDVTQRVLRGEVVVD